MNFLPTAEHEMLRHSLAASFGRVGPAADLAPLGAFGMLVPEERGGSGVGMAEAVIVLHEAGRAGAGGDLAARLLYADAVAQAMPHLSERVLDGAVPIIAPVAGELVCAAGRICGNLKLAEPGPGAWIVAPVEGSDDVAILAADIQARAPCAAIEAEAAACRVAVDLPEEEAPRIAVPELRSRLALLRCAEMLGAADHCLALAIGYMKDRSQFGQPIGANQALKHIAADSYLQLENARVAVDFAAAALDAADAAPSDRERRADARHACAMLLAYVPGATREIAETAIHLHGGIGLTWDYGLNAPLRRIVRLGMALGAPASHRQLLCDLFREACSGGRP